MTITSTKILIAAAVAAFAATGAAQASTIDFTGAPFQLNDSVVTGVTDFGVGFTLSSTGGSLNWTGFDGTGGTTGLAETFDGVGVDEITDHDATNESIILTFDRAVFVTGVGFLDLFVDPNLTNPGDNETAIVDFTNGSADKAFNGVQAPISNNPGFLNASFAAELTTQLVFSATNGNDGLGAGDFALASVDVAPVPLPAAAWLLMGGLAGLGLLGRKRRAA